MKKQIAIISLLLITVPSSFAQIQLNHYGSDNSYDLPHTTNQDVQSRILDALNTFFDQILKIGNSQDSKLQTIIDNQNKQIDNQNKEIEKLTELINLIGGTPQVKQTTPPLAVNCYHQGTGIVCDK